MSIYYALISRGATILVDYTECSGNFQEISVAILNKIDPSTDTMTSYSTEEYFFNVIIENGLIYMCMSDISMGKSVPYSYLREIKARFLSGSLKERARYCAQYDMQRDFQAVLSQQMRRYNKGEGEAPSKIKDLENDVKEVQSVMTQNIGKVLGRGANLNNLLDKTETLDQTSQSFANSSRQLRNKMWWQNKRACCILSTIVFLIIGVITVVVLYETHVIK